ncbi:MAG: ATP-binding protein, partial [Bdellovibrionales bacterium]
NGRLLLSIIDDVLDLSRVELGKIQFEKVPVSIFQMFSDLNILMKPRATAKGIQLISFIDPSVPEYIPSDSQRLRQILLNLIGNAIKFTENGRVELSVKRVADGENAGLFFTVKDTGVGIDPAHAKKIFNPFTQADASTTRRFGGTGLGLSLSRKIAQAMGGDISLTASSLGAGSTFTLSLGVDVLLEPTVQPKPELPADQRVNAKIENILVVDDNADNRLFMREILTQADYKFSSASGGKEALQLVQNGGNIFDIILMDLQMPDMDGYEATRELRKSGYYRPIIALTAHAMTSERQKCLDNGFDEHISKPIDRDHLFRVIENAARSI